MQVTKKQYKAMKREIIERGAEEVGYFYDVYQDLPIEDLLCTIRKIGPFIGSRMASSTIYDRLLTTAVEYMTYQDFKRLAPHFFSFQRFLAVNRERDEYKDFEKELPFDVDRKKYRRKNE